MGGKSHSTNDQMVAFEQQQAADAAQKEADRQARLASGTTAVNNIFDSANFDQNFYDKYTKAQTDYYMPQVQTQYDTAQKKLTYDLARAGTLRSTGAGYAQGLLDQQNIADQAGVTAQADQQTGALRTSILNDKQQAINQLYATEDPTVAANTATGMVQQGALSTPNLNPLGELFTPIAVGGLGAANSYLNNSLYARGLTGGLSGAPNPSGSYNQNTGN